LIKTEFKDIRPFVILLAEDNVNDIILTQKAFQQSKVYIKIYVTLDGEETLRFLNQIDEFRDAPIPDLILLDLNLPKKDGPDVLADIKSAPKLEHIPVVILTISDAEKDINESYKLHANCYIIKPVKFEDFIKNMKLIEDFWLSIVKLPRSKANA